MSIRINIENCVNQLCTGDPYDDGRKFTLQELIRHLKELRERTARGDLKALDEFFGVYVFNGDGGFKYKRGEDQPDCIKAVISQTSKVGGK